MEMMTQSRRVYALGLRLGMALALLACARASTAQGKWSVLSLPREPGEVFHPIGQAVDAAGNLYVADYWYDSIDQMHVSRIAKRDAQGHWSLMRGPYDFPVALAADNEGNLYVAEGSSTARLWKRDAQGDWSVITVSG